MEDLIFMQNFNSTDACWRLENENVFVYQKIQIKTV